MSTLFYITAAIALAGAVLAVTQRNAMHSILYLIGVLLAMALLFFLLGAPFLAALQVIIYAGAIVVLFLFVIMMINPDVGKRARPGWGGGLAGLGPLVLIAVLGIEWFYLLKGHSGTGLMIAVGPEMIGRRLFAEYALGVQLIALLLLVGLIGAFHLGRRT